MAEDYCGCVCVWLIITNDVNIAAGLPYNTKITLPKEAYRIFTALTGHRLQWPCYIEQIAGVESGCLLSRVFGGLHTALFRYYILLVYRCIQELYDCYISLLLIAVSIPFYGLIELPFILSEIALFIVILTAYYRLRH